MADYFIFGDFDSRDYNIYLHDEGNGRTRIISPPKTTTTDRIVGGHGEIIFDQFYNATEIPLNIFSVNDTNNDYLESVARYLSTLETQKLVLSYEPHKYYNCTIENPIICTEYGSQGQIYNVLNFKNHSGFGYSLLSTVDIQNGSTYDNALYDISIYALEGDSGYIYNNITTTKNIDIIHGGNTDFGMPNMIFNGTADSLMIRHYSDSARTNEINRFEYGAFNGTLEINSLENNVYLNNYLANNTSEYTDGFIRLRGIKTPSFLTKGIIVSNSGNQITLMSDASPVNDFYNNSNIVIINKVTLKNDVYKIVDYDGLTKTCTLDSTIGTNVKDKEYHIIMPDDGKNYLTISGTNLNISELKVDFKFVYL